MAEIIPSEKNSGKPSQKKKNIRIDMTPMVDLGFLLITFFMFAASFSKPNVMDLGLPAKGTKPPINTIDIRNQVTFILGRENRIFYYQKELQDLTIQDYKEINFEGIGVAKIIKNLKKNAPKPDIFTVIIKPTDDSNYKNFVDMMDEMAIAKQETYGVTDLKPKEEKLYQQILK